MFTNPKSSRFVPKNKWLSMLHPSGNTLLINALRRCKNGVLEGLGPRRKTEVRARESGPRRRREVYSTSPDEAGPNSDGRLNGCADDHPD